MEFCKTFQLVEWCFVHAKRGISVCLWLALRTLTKNRGMSAIIPRELDYKLLKVRKIAARFMKGSVWQRNNKVHTHIIIYVNVYVSFI